MKFDPRDLSTKGADVKNGCGRHMVESHLRGRMPYIYLAKLRVGAPATVFKRMPAALYGQSSKFNLERWLQALGNLNVYIKGIPRLG